MATLEGLVAYHFDMHLEAEPAQAQSLADAFSAGGDTAAGIAGAVQEATSSVTGVAEEHIVVLGMSPYGGGGRRLQQGSGLTVSLEVYLESREAFEAFLATIQDPTNSAIFTGLLMNTTPVLNQMAAALVFSVLLDTFVVRTLLLPAAMFSLGRYNWWPRAMPPSADEPGRTPLGCVCACVPVEID